jgi:cell pole-organizing protein PopZ
MTPKSDHEEDMSMEEILASIRKFVTDSPPEDPKQRVYGGDLAGSIVVPPTGHVPTGHASRGHAMERRQGGNYAQQAIEPSSLSAPQYGADVLELKSPLSPTRTSPDPSAEWGASTLPTRSLSQLGQEEAIITLTNPIDQKKGEKFSRFSAKPSPVGDQEASLGSSHAVTASANSLSRLAQVSKSALDKKLPNPADQRDITLDRFIQDMVRPMIKVWIDTHLPSLVEEMVAKEIKRITSHLK